MFSVEADGRPPFAEGRRPVVPGDAALSATIRASALEARTGLAEATGVVGAERNANGIVQYDPSGVRVRGLPAAEIRRAASAMRGHLARCYRPVRTLLHARVSTDLIQASRRRSRRSPATRATRGSCSRRCGHR